MSRKVAGSGECGELSSLGAEKLVSDFRLPCFLTLARDRYPRYPLPAKLSNKINDRNFYPVGFRTPIEVKSLFAHGLDRGMGRSARFPRYGHRPKRFQSIGRAGWRAVSLVVPGSCRISYPVVYGNERRHDHGRNCNLPDRGVGNVDLNMPGAPHADFGRYLASVTERDIDLLLMEEFQTSDGFVTWFCSELGLHDVAPAGAWHSLSDTDGESDLLLRVLREGRRIGILIENKIAAPEQDLQAERYHLRGIRSREQGKLDDYVTVMCAPRRYLDALSHESAYQHRVSYEQIAAWFSHQEGRRAAWRHQIMLEAIDQGRRGYAMAVNATVTGFYRKYWEYLRRRHPRIKMARPTNKGSRSTWFILKGHDFPKGVNMYHKFDQQVMELGFSKRKIADIRGIKSDWPDDIAVVQKGTIASLAINIPAIDMNLDFDAQLPAIEKALEAAYRLMPYASLFQTPDRTV